MKAWKLTCSKVSCRLHAEESPLKPYLPTYITDEYLLPDGSTIEAKFFRDRGWCDTCNFFTFHFAPEDQKNIESEVFRLEKKIGSTLNKYFGTVSYEESSQHTQRKKVLEVLRNRKDHTRRCLECNGTEIRDWNWETLTKNSILHPKCGGTLKVSVSNMHVSFRNLGSQKIIKVRLLDSNDNLVGYGDRLGSAIFMSH
jgi:hypothetical protein